MQGPSARDPKADVDAVLDPGEVKELVLETREAELYVTDRRLLVVAAGGRIRLAVTYRDVRRIAFDIEPHQGTIVIVPLRTTDEAQVLWVGQEDVRDAGNVLGLIGERMHSTGA